MGLARTGAISSHGSGDLFIAFSTGKNVIQEQPVDLFVLKNRWISHLHQAVIEATEEAILNSLTMAHSMTGRDGNTYHALPLDRRSRLCVRMENQVKALHKVGIQIGKFEPGARDSIADVKVRSSWPRGYRGRRFTDRIERR